MTTIKLRETFHVDQLTNFAQYLRVEDFAVGLFSSPREFVRASRKLLAAKGKSRERRLWRRCWLAALWQHRLNQQAFYISARF